MKVSSVPATPSISITSPNPTIGTINPTLDFSSATQYATSFAVTDLSQDGYAPGDFVSLSIGDKYKIPVDASANVHSVTAVGEHRARSIVVNTAVLPPGVSGQWRQYADYDEFLIQDGLPTADRTLAHELGHLVLGHDGMPVIEAAREVAEVAGDDLISYMLNQRTGCMGPGGEDVEQEAEDFAALLIYRLGRLPSDRASIVQVRLGEAFG